MAFLEWNDRYAIGITTIDAQHQELFRRVSSLMAAMGGGGGQQAVPSLLRFLEDYVITHFSEEQGEMARAKYPGLPAHVAQHDAFITDLARLKNELTETGPTVSFTVAVNNRVCSWLVDHVLGSDRAFGTYHQLRRNAVPGKKPTP